MKIYTMKDVEQAHQDSQNLKENQRQQILEVIEVIHKEINTYQKLCQELIEFMQNSLIYDQMAEETRFALENYTASIKILLEKNESFISEYGEQDYKKMRQEFFNSALEKYQKKKNNDDDLLF